MCSAMYPDRTETLSSKKKQNGTGLTFNQTAHFPSFLEVHICLSDCLHMKEEIFTGFGVALLLS